MPKNEHNNLEPSSVRYVLHRYFAQKHGWHMIGLDRGAGAWKKSAPASILKHQVPTYIEDIFEKTMNAKGLGLSELAVLAATFSDLTNRETVQEMYYIYKALRNRSPSSNSRRCSEASSSPRCGAWRMGVLLKT